MELTQFPSSTEVPQEGFGERNDYHNLQLGSPREVFTTHRGDDYHDPLIINFNDVNYGAMSLHQSSLIRHGEPHLSYEGESASRSTSILNEPLTVAWVPNTNQSSVFNSYDSSVETRYQQTSNLIQPSGSGIKIPATPSTLQSASEYNVTHPTFAHGYAPNPSGSKYSGTFGVPWNCDENNFVSGEPPNGYGSMSNSWVSGPSLPYNFTHAGSNHSADYGDTSDSIVVHSPIFANASGNSVNESTPGLHMNQSTLTAPRKRAVGSVNMAASSTNILPELQTGFQMYPNTCPASPINAYSKPRKPLHGLRFNNAEEARPHRARRIMLDIPYDDVNDVKAEPTVWVIGLKAALCHLDYGNPDSKKSNGKSITKVERAEWKRWQEAQVTQLQILFSIETISEEAEAHAWYIFEKIIDVHERGYFLRTISPDTQSMCSRRLIDAIAVINKYAIVRAALFDGEDVEGFADNSLHYAESKVNNLWLNFNRSKKTDEQRGIDAQKALANRFTSRAYKKRHTHKELRVLISTSEKTKAQAQTSTTTNVNDKKGVEDQQTAEDLAFGVGSIFPGDPPYGYGNSNAMQENGPISSSASSNSKRPSASTAGGVAKKAKISPSEPDPSSFSSPYQDGLNEVPYEKWCTDAFD